jgi:hypothetical protein
MRDIPVEGPLLSEARKLQNSLTPRPDEEQEERLSNKILSAYHADLMDRAEWENRLVEWDNAYHGRVEEKIYPWPGAANFHVPLTAMGIETFKPRLVEGVMGQTPPIMVVPTTGALEDRKEKVETFLNWQTTVEMKIAPIVAQSAHLFLHPGLAVAKTYWKVERKRRKFIREFPAETELPAILEALFGTQLPQDLEEVGDLKWTGMIPTTLMGGSALEVTLQLNYVEDSGAPVVQVLVERDEVIEGPQVDLIDPTDLIVPVKGGDDPNKLPHIIHRLWLTEDDLRRKALQGAFYKDVVQDLIDSGAPRGDQPTTDSNAWRQAQDTAEGVEGQGPSNVRRLQFEVLEAYCQDDIDGDGLVEEIIVWTSPHARGRILGWDYLDNVYAHGRRPFRVGKFYPLPFRFYGLAFAEVVRGIQEEINAIHNQRVDYGTIQNLPWFVYRGSSSLAPITPSLRPGQGIAVDNPGDVLFPKWQGDPAWGQQEEAVLMQYFERLTGLTDLSIGRQPNRVGATRTAAGTQTLLSEAGLRFKGAMTAFQTFWIGVFSDILALDQEYLPPNKEFRVTGKSPTVIKIKDRTEIRGEYDLRLASTSETMNRQKQREDATAVTQFMLNPLLMQGGIVGLKGVRWAAKKFLRAYGEDPDLALEAQAPIRDPQEELLMFHAGSYVSPVQGEAVPLHLATHQAQLADPALTPECRSLLQRHVQETLQLQQQMLMMQMAQQQGVKGPQGPQAANGAQGASAPQPGAPVGPPVGGTPPTGGMPPSGPPRA